MATLIKKHHPAFTRSELQRIFDLATQSYYNPTINTSPQLRQIDQTIMIITGNVLKRKNNDR